MIAENCYECRYYDSNSKHHNCKAKIENPEHYIDCILVQYGSCYNSCLIKQK